MREPRAELSLHRKRGEKHLTIKDGEVVTAPIPMEIRRDHNNRGTKPSNSEALNAASRANTEMEAL